MDRGALESMVNAAQEKIEARGDLDDAAKAKAKEALEEVKQMGVEVPDTQVYRIAVGSVAAIAGLIVIGALLIVMFKLGDVPEFLRLALATALGALAGMIVPTAKAGT